MFLLVALERIGKMKKQLLATLGLVLALAACESGMDQNVNVGSAATPGTAEDFRANIKDRVFFGLNKSQLTPEAKIILQAQAGWLKTYGNTHAVIEGYCDERGTREYNLALGARRAGSVRKGLIHDGGINAKRLKTKSFGKDNPPVSGTGEDVWAQNRTAVTVIQ